MKNGIVTGASRGIGRAIAARLGKAGYNLILQGRDVEDLAESCRLVQEANGKAVPVIADLSDPTGVDELVNGVEFVPPHLLVNNAGVAYVKPFEDLTLEEWQETIAVNVTAPFLLVKKLLPVMSHDASIVNILSVAAKAGIPGWSSYCMSKFALDGFMQSIREELREKGVRVINIYPSATGTELWDHIKGNWPKEKMLAAEEVAEAVFFAAERPSSVLIENISLGNIAGKL